MCFNEDFQQNSKNRMNLYSVIEDLDLVGFAEYHSNSYSIKTYEIFLRNYHFIKKFTKQEDTLNFKKFKKKYITKQIQLICQQMQKNQPKHKISYSKKKSNGIKTKNKQNNNYTISNIGHENRLKDIEKTDRKTLKNTKQLQIPERIFSKVTITPKIYHSKSLTKVIKERASMNLKILSVIQKQRQREKENEIVSPKKIYFSSTFNQIISSPILKKHNNILINPLINNSHDRKKRFTENLSANQNLKLNQIKPNVNLTQKSIQSHVLKMIRLRKSSRLNKKYQLKTPLKCFNLFFRQGSQNLEERQNWKTIQKNKIYSKFFENQISWDSKLDSVDYDSLVKSKQCSPLKLKKQFVLGINESHNIAQSPSKCPVINKNQKNCIAEENCHRKKTGRLEQLSGWHSQSVQTDLCPKQVSKKMMFLYPFREKLNARNFQSCQQLLVKTLLNKYT